MKRKIIQHGPSSLIVSLPSKWTKKSNIKKGDEIEIIEDGNNLLITTSNETLHEKKLEINITDSSKFISMNLVTPYILGYTEIKVNYKDKKVFNLISKELSSLMGFEIISQAKNSCVIKSVASGIKEDFEDIQKRVFSSTLIMVQNLSEAVNKNNFSGIEEFKILEKMNYKLSNFCLRMLNLKGYPKKDLTNSAYCIILSVAEMTDDLKEICSLLEKNNSFYSKRLKEAMKNLRLCLEDGYSLFYDFNLVRLYEHKTLLDKLKNKVTSSLKKSPEESIILSYILSIANKMLHISMQINY